MKADVTWLVGLQKQSLTLAQSFDSFQYCTFGSLVKLIFPKDDAEVMKGAGVKLHPEHHVSTRGSVAFVIALELKGEKTKSMKVVLQAEPKEHNSVI